MKWDTLDGNWTDANETYRLPFVIEYDLGNEPAPNLVAAKGFRKVLVVPARFQDEGYGINGYSAPLTDQFGNPIFPNYKTIVLNLLASQIWLLQWMKSSDTSLKIQMVYLILFLLFRRR